MPIKDPEISEIIRGKKYFFILSLSKYKEYPKPTVAGPNK
jgi:hypothetical protein